ncbi:hypothetical protein M513_13294, partial [Trichuris suis]
SVCQHAPCENNGTCFENGDHYTCNCLPVYTGQNCTEEIRITLVAGKRYIGYTAIGVGGFAVILITVCALLRIRKKLNVLQSPFLRKRKESVEYAESAAVSSLLSKGAEDFLSFEEGKTTQSQVTRVNCSTANDKSQGKSEYILPPAFKK